MYRYPAGLAAPGSCARFPSQALQRRVLQPVCASLSSPYRGDNVQSSFTISDSPRIGRHLARASNGASKVRAATARGRGRVLIVTRAATESNGRFSTYISEREAPRGSWRNDTSASDTSYLPKFYSNGSQAGAKPAADAKNGNNSKAASTSGPPALTKNGSTSIQQASSTTTRVAFKLKYKAEFGQSIRVLGSGKQLGNWSLAAAINMKWTAGDIWTCNVDFPSGMILEYKYVVIGEDGRTAAAWQSGGNSVLALLPDDTEVEVFDNWENQPGAAVVSGSETSTREKKLQAWAGEMSSHRAEARNLRMQLVQSQDELRAVKSEVAALRLEMQAATQARLESEARRLEADKELAQLHRELHKTQLMLKATMEEALRLLREPDSDEDETYVEQQQLQQRVMDEARIEEEKLAQWREQQAEQIRKQEELRKKDEAERESRKREAEARQREAEARQRSLEAEIKAREEQRAKEERQRQQAEERQKRLQAEIEAREKQRIQQEEQQRKAAEERNRLLKADMIARERAKAAEDEERKRQEESAAIESRRIQAELERQQWAREMEERRRQQEVEEQRQRELVKQRELERQSRQWSWSTQGNATQNPTTQPGVSWRSAVEQPAPKPTPTQQPAEQPQRFASWLGLQPEKEKKEELVAAAVALLGKEAVSAAAATPAPKPAPAAKPAAAPAAPSPAPATPAAKESGAAKKGGKKSWRMLLDDE